MVRLASLLFGVLLLLVSHSGGGGAAGRRGVLLSAEGALINAISIVQNQTPLADQLMQAALAAYASVFSPASTPPTNFPPSVALRKVLMLSASVFSLVCFVSCCDCCVFSFGLLFTTFCSSSAQCATSRLGAGIENGLPARRCDEFVGCACFE
jgi:hypothetical protein